MIVLDKLLIGGIRFVLDKVLTAVDQEMNDDTSLRQQLLEGQMRVELGEMSQEEFAALEKDVLERLREIQARRQGGQLGPHEFKGQKPSVEATFESDEGSEPRES